MATELQLAWLKTMVAPAKLSMARWKVPASVTLAQCILESAWGTSQLARRCSNYFGVKAVQGEAYGEFPTREVVSGRSIVELAHFAKYPSAIESFNRHAQLLASLPRYEFAMSHAANLRLFCEGLVRGGYSTEPEYAERLMELVDQFGLRQYDTPAPETTDAATEA